MTSERFTTAMGGKRSLHSTADSDPIFSRRKIAVGVLSACRWASPLFEFLSAECIADGDLNGFRPSARHGPLIIAIECDNDGFGDFSPSEHICKCRRIHVYHGWLNVAGAQIDAMANE